MAHEDFRGTSTYFALAVFKKMISSIIMNQNMRKNALFFEKICKNSTSSGGSASRSHLPSGGWGLCIQTPLPRSISPTTTVLL